MSAPVTPPTTAPTTGSGTASGLDGVLAVLREHALLLSAAGPQPPDRVRVEAAGAAVELAWAGAAAPEDGASRHPSRRAVPGPPAAAAATNGSAPSPVAGPVPADEHRLTSPTVGVFYSAAEPGAPPFVAVGDVVAAGQQVAIVEAMKLMIPVEADRPGRVVAVLVQNGSPVEYGQPLLALAP